jgi:hypothetical protein
VRLEAVADNHAPRHRAVRQQELAGSGVDPSRVRHPARLPGEQAEPQQHDDGGNVPLAAPGQSLVGQPREREAGSGALGRDQVEAADGERVQAVLPGQLPQDATAILEYFAPLQKWLDEQNRGAPTGW